MSKKNKNRKFDYFDMSYEEQIANAQMFNDLEEGTVDITQIGDYVVPEAPFGQSDLNRQIENRLLGKEDDSDRDPIRDAVENIYGTQDEEDSGYYDGNNIFFDPDPVSAKVTEKKVATSSKPQPSVSTVTTVDHASATVTTVKQEQESPKCTIPEITCRYNRNIGKLFVDDGLVSTPISAFFGFTTEIDTAMIPSDADELGELMSSIFYYIISCKYPSVIMTEGTFELEFSIYQDVNINKFMFFRNNGYVFVYVIQEDAIDNFYSVFDDLKSTNIPEEEMQIRFMLGAALAAGTVHNIFPSEDDDEVDCVMDIRHDIKGLLKLIDEDPDTEYAGHNSGNGSVWKNLRVIKFNEFQRAVRQKLTDLEPYEEDEDEDDYNDEEFNVGNVPDGESDEESEDDDFPDIIDSKTGTDDIDRMMDELEDEYQSYHSDESNQSVEEEPEEEAYIPEEHEIPEEIIDAVNPPTAMQPKSRVEASSNSGSMVVPIVHRRK